MAAFKLFISHSSRLDEIEASEDPAKNPNLKLLLDVIKLIRQEYGDTIEILVDKDKHGLPVGDDWEKRLNEWLAECHAAIILFSERARVNSNWVKKEATILSWRRELEEDFKLIPICLKGQTSADQLSEDLLGTLRINKSQCIRDVKNAQDILTGIKHALGAKETLASQCMLTPFDKLETVISKLLVKNADGDILEDTWDSLDTRDKPAWHPDSEVRFSHALARYLVRNGEQCLDHFEVIVNKIRPKLSKDHTKELLEYIRPLWVKTNSAACILAARSQETQTPNQYIVMSGMLLSKFTLKRYIERAWPMDNTSKLVLTTATEKTKLIKEIQDEFQSKRLKLDPEKCDGRINSFNRQILVYLTAAEHMGGGLLDDSRLRIELAEKYPNIIFVLDCGEQLPTNIPNEIIKVKPELDIQFEHTQMIAEENTDDFLDDFYDN